MRRVQKCAEHGMAPGYCVVPGCPHEEKRSDNHHSGGKTTATRLKQPICYRCRSCIATIAVPVENRTLDRSVSQKWYCFGCHSILFGEPAKVESEALEEAS